MPDIFDETLFDIAVRLGLATLFGLVLGLERELMGKPAGLRTHMLVTLGAATTTLAALGLYDDLVAQHPDTNADPLRAVEGVIAAIGFLGAGVIIRGADNDVRHLTTAANVWLAGAIGLTCGAGLFKLATAAFVLTLVILTLMRFVERAFLSGRDSG